tara:strand:- start:26362 stop:26982 length:621 start_codon:yes stop_codon:yes gene_type:complete
LHTPTLIIVAGCNGSGKSTFSKTYIQGIKPFDYDKRYLEIYHSLPDSELKDMFAKNKTTKEFESSIYGAFSNREDFCYETNFDNHPIDYVITAIEKGYQVHLHFYCLDDIELAKERVSIRTVNQGHFVPNNTIEYKWKEGYRNLNLYYNIFDYILLIDNSYHLKTPTNLFSLSKVSHDSYAVEKYSENIPEYSKRRFPDIYKFIAR